jgi:hypothetical protein
MTNVLTKRQKPFLLKIWHRSVLNSSLDYTCTLILDWKAFLEGQIISGMWTPRTQQKDQIDILEMKETCLLISNRTFSTGLTLATYNTTAVAYFNGLSLLFLGPLLKVYHGSLSTNITFVPIDFFSLLIQISIKELTVLTHSEKASVSSFSRFLNLLSLAAT